MKTKLMTGAYMHSAGEIGVFMKMDYFYEQLGIYPWVA